MIADEIRRTGPLPVERFMALALHHPTHGYYRTRDPLGAGGDFVTAPELSQAFGEVIGAWLARAWLDLGQPAPFRLVELGPGRGTLLDDVLRATRRVPGFHDGLHIHLVETSERLRRAQAARLADLHVELARRSRRGAARAACCCSPTSSSTPCRCISWSAPRAAGSSAVSPWPRVAASSSASRPRPRPWAQQLPEATPGAVAEVSPARAALAQAIGGRIARDGGVALVIDYGAWAEGPTGDTLQATRDHGPCDPLDAPGTADLTTHVDFRALALAACDGGAAVYGPVPQGTFLTSFGIHLRTAKLLERAAPAQQRQLRAALFRLIDPSAMGELFKVVALAHPAAPAPPGFAAPTLRPC